MYLLHSTRSFSMIGAKRADRVDGWSAWGGVVTPGRQGPCWIICESIPPMSWAAAWGVLWPWHSVFITRKKFALSCSIGPWEDIVGRRTGWTGSGVTTI